MLYTTSHDIRRQGNPRGTTPTTAGVGQYLLPTCHTMDLIIKLCIYRPIPIIQYCYLSPRKRWIDNYYILYYYVLNLLGIIVTVQSLFLKIHSRLLDVPKKSLLFHTFEFAQITLPFCLGAVTFSYFKFRNATKVFFLWSKDCRKATFHQYSIVSHST